MLLPGFKSLGFGTVWTSEIPHVGQEFPGGLESPSFPSQSCIHSCRILMYEVCGLGCDNLPKSSRFKRNKMPNTKQFHLVLTKINLFTGTLRVSLFCHVQLIDFSVQTFVIFLSRRKDLSMECLIILLSAQRVHFLPVQSSREML